MSTSGPIPDRHAQLDALRAVAEREHRAGRLAEAAEACRKILALRPDLAEPNNNLGVLLAQQGRLAEAAPWFQRAITLRPDYVEAYNNLGNVLLSQGRFDEAATQFEAALALRPDLADSYLNLGNVLWKQRKLAAAAARFESAIALRPDYCEAHNYLALLLLSAGKLEAAAAHFERVLALRPDFAEAHNHLGNILWHLGKPDHAAAHLERAIALRPDYAEAYNNLGILLVLTGRHGLALVRFEQAVTASPDFADAHNNLGNVLWKQNKLDTAAAAFRRALSINPDHVEALNNLGYVLRNQGRLDEAMVHSQRAATLRPNYPDPHNNLGVVFTGLGQLEAAIGWFERALALKPDYAEAHSNFGNVLVTQGKLDEAAEHYHRALAVEPNLAEAAMGLAVYYLVQGDYERGWPAYEARLRLPRAIRQPNLPRWLGEPLAGRSLLLLDEQGLGDTIHFLRYARLFKARGARVVLAARAALGPLLAGHPDLDEFVRSGPEAVLPRCDFYLPLFSSGLALGTNASTIPGEVPYLSPDPELTARWREELAPIEGFKVGIVWQGSPSYTGDRWRSIPLAALAPLARLPGVRLVSLQKNVGTEQIKTVDFPVLDLSDRLDGETGAFMDTAAVIRNLDLIVSANTAVAHLAGALAAPVFLAVDSAPDWRWLRDREDSAWYPTMRLFRQTALGRWSDVFERMAPAVAELTRAKETAR